MINDPLLSRASRLSTDDLRNAIRGPMPVIFDGDPTDRYRKPSTAYSAYIAKVIGRLEIDMQTVDEGGRNMTLNRCCYKLGQLVASAWAGVDQAGAQECLAKLCNAAYERGLSWAEIKSTARCGYEAGIEEPLQEPG